MDTPNNSPYFSVIIPTLNEERYLPNLLECLVNQTYKNFEVIISDAKSTDKTPEVASKYENKLHLTIITSDKRNVAHQRNMGAACAHAENLLFVDADGALKKDFLELLQQEIQADGSNAYIFYLGVETENILIKKMSQFINFIAYYSQFLPNSFTSGGFICVKKSVFHDVHGYDDSVYYAEDTDFTNRIRHSGYKVKLLYNLEVVFSLRRVDKVGLWQALFTLVYGSLPPLLWGRMKKRIPLFDYPMHGGGSYEHRKH